MRCNFCEGTGMRPHGGAILPCPECGGCGVAHCCDGIQACCEVEGDMRLASAKEIAQKASATAAERKSRARAAPELETSRPERRRRIIC